MSDENAPAPPGRFIYNERVVNRALRTPIPREALEKALAEDQALAEDRARDDAETRVKSDKLYKAWVGMFPKPLGGQIQSYDPEADMDNADEPHKLTESEAYLAGVLGIDQRFLSNGTIDLLAWAAREIIQLREMLRLEIEAVSDKPAPDPKPEPPHRAPEVWARIRSL